MCVEAKQNSRIAVCIKRITCSPMPSFLSLFFFSWHHVLWYNWLLEEDCPWRRRQGFLQGCLVQRPQRNGWCFCPSLVWRNQEIHISYSPPGWHLLCYVHGLRQNYLSVPTEVSTGWQRATVLLAWSIYQVVPLTMGLKLYFCSVTSVKISLR